MEKGHLEQLRKEGRKIDRKKSKKEQGKEGRNISEWRIKEEREQKNNMRK